MTDMKKIESNWNTYSGLLGRFQDVGINNLLEELGQRLCVAPANPRSDQYGCFAGGLIDSSLKITSLMKKYAAIPHQLESHSIIKVGLLHDIGRVGTLSEDWLAPQDSDWHHDRGFHFKQNFDLDKLEHYQRTLFLIQHFGVKLSVDEYSAVVSLSDQTARNLYGANLLHARNVHVLYS